jgi:hypothetical protein
MSSASQFSDCLLLRRVAGRIGRRSRLYGIVFLPAERTEKISEAG